MLKKLLTDRQRNEIIEYLRVLPNGMPQYIRGLKNQIKGLDFDAMEKDLALMRRLSELEIPMGRKKINWRQLPAYVTIRQKASEGLPAELRVRHPETEKKRMP